MTLTNFLFGSAGSAGGSPTTIGGASGDLSAGVTLNDSTAFNAFLGTFTPGSSLSFHVDLSTNVDSGGTPDAFAFSILDSGGGSIPTLDPSGADTLLAVNIDSANPTILTYRSDPSRLTNGGFGVAITMDAPTTAAASTAVPEPATALLLAVGIAAMTMGKRKLVRLLRSQSLLIP